MLDVGLQDRTGRPVRNPSEPQGLDLLRLADRVAAEQAQGRNVDIGGARLEPPLDPAEQPAAYLLGGRLPGGRPQSLDRTATDRRQLSCDFFPRPVMVIISIIFRRAGDIGGAAAVVMSLSLS